MRRRTVLERAFQIGMGALLPLPALRSAAAAAPVAGPVTGVTTAIELWRAGRRVALGQALTIQVHREVSWLGDPLSSPPILGRKEIAGSLVFTNFDRHERLQDQPVDDLEIRVRTGTEDTYRLTGVALVNEDWDAVVDSSECAFTYVAKEIEGTRECAFPYVSKEIEITRAAPVSHPATVSRRALVAEPGRWFAPL
jgi:hypothetical protein